MDRNTVIGLTLIFGIFIAWQYVMAPSPEEVEAQKKAQDSLAQVEAFKADSLKRIETNKVNDTIDTPTEGNQVQATVSDSMKNAQLAVVYGPFAGSAIGEEKEFTLENKLFKITFSNKGGFIKSVELQDHYKVIEDDEGQQTKEKLTLLNDEKNRFEYILPLNNVINKSIRTSELYFEAKQQNNSISFIAKAGQNQYFEQTYTIHPDDYRVDYAIKLEGLNSIIPQNTEQITLNWLEYLDKLEINTQYERRYSTVYYKKADDDPTYCSCTSSQEKESEEPLKWVSHSNQFFNTTLLAEQPFRNGVMSTEMLEEDASDLKKLTTALAIPYSHGQSEVFAMKMYIGPNEFDRLTEFGNDVNQIVPFGSSILGTINRWGIRPIFNFLSGYIGSKGIVILVLTLIVKLLLYPLTYRMLYSQSKMGALKPQLEKMRERFKDDAQKQQMEQMKIYREFGVNPLGGCMPMVLQMPIWIALYRFFPASIEFRQASFLWATDLSSYDVFFQLPFEIPFGFGSHISLFTLLWAITTLIYTYYNTRHMDMSANPAMKYMQYVMPLFFMGFFNSFASGLTCYLLFSNLFNITQTIVTKNVIINQDKIKKELEAYKKKPKKKGGFQARLEKALKEQQKMQETRDSSKKKKK